MYNNFDSPRCRAVAAGELAKAWPNPSHGAVR
jgi:hypothetical protein